ncbi:TPA: restriction endonuclease subunit S [Streptococcus equi subsp. zooepidemicus]|nr:restriction endonuclease subunit S [Streptococcus equi subsp. zooepidemicus]
MRKMKDSGIDWIGEIPEEWEIEAISRVFSQRNVKVSDFEYAPLSVTKQGVVPQLDSAAKSDDHSNRKLVKRGDFVINSRSDRKMSAGISQYDGSVSLINLVMKPMDDKLQTDFIGYLMKNYGFAEEFYRWGSGIVADLWSTNWERARKIQLPLPPSPEQEKIAQFLDRKTALIDDIIKDTKTSIEELKAYKQSLITEIVTKGLDPTVKLVPSGIEWVGDVPEGWKVVKSRYFLREVSIKGYTNEEVLSLYRDYGIVPKNSRSDNHNVTSLDTSGYKFIRPGNLVINKMKAW